MSILTLPNPLTGTQRARVSTARHRAAGRVRIRPYLADRLIARIPRGSRRQP